MILDAVKSFFEPSPPNRQFLCPEVIQTSAMDCGPASLKAILDGFGLPASYGRLREACQTDVDGTSIDTIEEADFGSITTGTVVLAAHGSRVEENGTIIGTKLGKKLCKSGFLFE